jgi:hypothetical protein
MITYGYWTLTVLLALGVFYMVGYRLGQWVAGAAAALLLFAILSSTYYFYLQQMFVKRWGGVMSVSVPHGQRHIAVTWKDDNFWIENYDPESNTCIFQEYSRGGLLEGKVVIKDCNPLLQKLP